jgi:hypothetical protein
MSGYNILTEALNAKQPFIIHKHNPRNGSEHYDLRFLDPHDNKLLHSFATPSNFLETIDNKSLLIKTRDHDPRWLTLKSHRLTDIDTGTVSIKTQTSKYFELIFNGKVINGKYKLFKLKTKRDDHWLFIKNK